MFMKAPIALLLAVIASPSFADSLALDLNDNSLRLNYQHSLDTNYQADAAWIHTKDLGNTVTAGLNLKQTLNNDITALIGGKAVFQQHDTLPDGTAIAIGGTLRVTPAANKNVAVSLSGYFAPNVLSFGDMDNYRELELRGEYQVSEQLTAYVGYRNNRADYGNLGSHNLYDGAMIGGEFHF
jgi:hypothetical protein